MCVSFSPATDPRVILSSRSLLLLVPSFVAVVLFFSSREPFLQLLYFAAYQSPLRLLSGDPGFREEEDDVLLLLLPLPFVMDVEC